MLETLGDVAIGLVLFAVYPRFLRFEASLVLYPAIVLTFLVMSGGLMLRAYTGG